MLRRPCSIFGRGGVRPGRSGLDGGPLTQGTNPYAELTHPTRSSTTRSKCWHRASKRDNSSRAR